MLVSYSGECRLLPYLSSLAADIRQNCTVLLVALAKDGFEPRLICQEGQCNQDRKMAVKSDKGMRAELSLEAHARDLTFALQDSER